MQTKFELGPLEEKRAEEFIKKHIKCSKEHPTAIGGSITYIFTPTSIGTAVEVECSLCGESENITDYGRW